MLPWFHHRFPLALAPMAGVTDSVFRRLCKQLGADLLISEFVSAEGILHRNQRTRDMIAFHPSERPVGIQLFGADPTALAEAARAVCDWVGPDFIDLNFGCPVNKVVCKNGGSALLRDGPLLARVARAVVRASPVPVTAKIRLGWDAASINAPANARILAAEGIRALAVHGRTKEQGYTGSADWNRIADVVQAVPIPVIGNGDLDSPEIVLQRRAQTGVAGAMFGRAAMASPWIFSRTRAALNGDPIPPEPDWTERWTFIQTHCRLEVEERGNEHAVMTSMRARLMAYTRGHPGGKRLREQLQHIRTLAQLDAIAAEHLTTLTSA
ncbi:MAG: tRNA dihydrouridine synthase DusB [Verrucomicrobiia bacterium]